MDSNTNKIQYSHGGPPCWTFIDEKWKMKTEKMQQRYKKELKLFKKKRKAEVVSANKMHMKLLDMVGPEWFQELSPLQIQTVNNLKNCIEKDILDNTIINVQENIAALGLVLRPNKKHLQQALEQCCNCPVEFLLVLYQLINPKRKTYTINDRLLLSGVVHLTMTETLRELHIRIPSPPPPVLKTPKKIKKNKKVKYESPYLEPLDYKHEPHKFRGIYKNKHIQRPTSPYFSYVPYLKAEILNQKEIETPEIDSELELDDVQKEVEEELKLAQRKYDQLATSQPSPRLMRPSIFVTCDNLFHQLMEASKKQRMENQDDDDSDNDYLHKFDSDVEVCAADFGGTCCCTDECGATENRENNAKKLNNYKNNQMLSDSAKKSSPAKTEVKKPEDQCRIKVQKNGNEDINIEKQSDRLSSIKVPTEDDNKCLENSKIERILERKDDGIKPFCARPLEKSSSTICVKPEINKHPCKCKEEYEKFMQQQCKCEECEDNKPKPPQINQISGYRQTESGQLLPIIGGIRGQYCDCLIKYKQKIDQYENYVKRIEARNKLKSQKHKYIIGGVVNSAEGPIYIISGTRPTIYCQCAERIRQEQEEQQRLANAPKPIEGRIKYAISGVKETEKGNVFIISGAVPREDCKCMEIFNKFEIQHKNCLKMYDQYMKHIETQLQEYQNGETLEDEEEVVVNVNYSDSFDFEGSGDNSGSLNESEAHKKSDIVENATVNTATADIITTSTVTTTNTTKTGTTLQTEVDTIRKVKINNCVNICSQPQTQQEQAEECEEIEIIEEAYETINMPKFSSRRKDYCTCIKEKPMSDLKRFFILDKFPTNINKQNEILKEVLNQMADDGFPLAKLPDCYKLPHFKLWFEMRLKVFWTQEDKLVYLTKNKIFSNHLVACRRQIEVPELSISRKEANKLTWANAAYCRRIVSEKQTMFYRQVRQANVDSGREFYPSTFQYEFPCATFRDCFFAYTSSKEEDVIAVQIWQLHEIKNK